MDASVRSASAMVAFSATYPESLQGDHLIWLYEGVPQPTLQLQENVYAPRRATAGNLATTVLTLMTTRNKFM